MASCEDEVLQIGKKLEKMMNGEKSDDGATELIEILEKLPISFEILTKTRIGLILNDLRKKTKDERLAKRIKSLIKDWKSLVDVRLSKPSPVARSDSTNSNSNSRDSPSQPSSQSNSRAPPSNPPTPAAAAAVSAPPLTTVVEEFSGAFPPAELMGDETRCKSAQMLLSALRVGDLPDGVLDPEGLAVKIEQKLYEVHKGVTNPYRAALRSRVFNLRDKKNVALRENVLTGVVSPQKFAVMTAEDMASPEIKQMREKFAKESIEEHQMSVQTGTPSDMFKCGKCRKKNCTYTQLQTRSSDEPMTTFVFCLECGNRWKFC